MGKRERKTAANKREVHTFLKIDPRLFVSNLKLTAKLHNFSINIQEYTLKYGYDDVNVYGNDEESPLNTEIRSQE